MKNIIIIDNSSYSKGGTAQVAYQSALELKKRGYNIVFVCADDIANKELVDEGIEVICIPYTGIASDKNKLRAFIKGIFNYNAYKKLSILLKRFDYTETIVHVHGYLHCFSPSIFKAIYKNNFKVVLTLHDYFISCPCGGFYNYNLNKICDVKSCSKKCIFSNCDKKNYFNKIWRLTRQIWINKYVKNENKLNLIYISNFSYDKLKKYIGNHKTYYVKNPYDLGENKIYEAYKNSNYVYLGRLSIEKGINIFCDAFEKLSREEKIIGKAVIIGDGNEKEKLEKKYPNIQFIGWKNHNELSEVFETTRVLVFPSKWYEGAPLTPIEFMSHGIPIVSSNACAAIEYIENEHNGLIFESNDVIDLKDKLEKVADDEYWKKICDNLIRDFNKNDYSVESHVDYLLEVYKDIIGD